MSLTETKSVLAEVDAQAFFEDAVQTALSHQHLKVHHETVIYLINLLHIAIYTERVFDVDSNRQGHKPLALIYGEALDAPSISHRDIALKKLGDISLFISGVFANSLERSLVDVDYYIKMGGSAYSFLADSKSVSRRTEAYKIVYLELSEQFTDLVDVLAEVCEESHMESSMDIMRLYKIWQRTGSQRSLKKLRSVGIEPIQAKLTRH
jgi:hypothetical protein